VSWERVAAGVTRATLWLPVAPGGSAFSAGSVLCMLALDVVVWGALAWYCDKVLPAAPGQRLPPWFVVWPAYWRRPSGADGGEGGGGEGGSEGVREPLLAEGDGGGGGAATPSSPTTTTPPPRSVAVRVRGLRKVYASEVAGAPPKVALEGLDLDIPSAAVTALLGPNGAGKTTAIHMLTGE
jgi:ABC-type multidrug transport system fused ATPase/permease subunit